MPEQTRFIGDRTERGEWILLCPKCLIRKDCEGQEVFG